MERRVLVVAAGWGVVCALANLWSVTSTFGQMAVPWVWMAAWAGWLAGDRIRAAVTGGVVLVISTLAYFAVTFVSLAIASEAGVGGYRFVILWTAVSIVVGPVAGIFGHLVTDGRRRRLAVGAIAAVSVAEPLALWPHIDHVNAHVTYLVVGALGIAIVWTLRPRLDARLATSVGALVAAYPIAVALELLLIALGQVSAPMRLL